MIVEVRINADNRVEKRWLNWLTHTWGPWLVML
jgi:hypothetical protein